MFELTEEMIKHLEIKYKQRMVEKISNNLESEISYQSLLKFIDNLSKVGVEDIKDIIYFAKVYFDNSQFVAEDLKAIMRSYNHTPTLRINFIEQLTGLEQEKMDILI